jgi:hypothetical protein
MWVRFPHRVPFMNETIHKTEEKIVTYVNHGYIPDTSNLAFMIGYKNEDDTTSVIFYTEEFIREVYERTEVLGLGDLIGRKIEFAYTDDGKKLVRFIK